MTSMLTWTTSFAICTYCVVVATNLALVFADGDVAHSTVTNQNAAVTQKTTGKLVITSIELVSFAMCFSAEWQSLSLTEH